ncbi:MAG: hypothetical protein BGO76_06170 [Caedibacter sp. 38-128]|nr:hypothetical protein [Holosporales bacterium]OJX03310.1 MAG: hypothetical protein BGO76_06170 [Caedibacter sp. 38-128]
MKNFLAIISAVGIVAITEAQASPDMTFEEDQTRTATPRSIMVDLSNDLAEEIEGNNTGCVNGVCW